MLETIFPSLFAILSIPLGIYAALGIWYPDLRLPWRGTRIMAGPVTYAGFVLVFIWAGIFSPSLDQIPMQNRVWAALPFLTGLFLVFVGLILDFLVHYRQK